MSKKHSIIELNGRRYDAKTGARLDHSGRSVTSQATHPASPVVKSQPAKPDERTTTHIPQTKTVKPSSTKRRETHSVRAHQPQKTHTLMRKAVRRPAAGHRPQALRALSPLDTGDARPEAVVIVKTSVQRLDDERMRHAKQISHSRLISRFSRDQFVAEPATMAALTTATAIAQGPLPQPQPAERHKPTSKAKRPRTTADILELAVQHATSHLEPPVEPAKHHRRWHRKAAASH